ncbi:bifunctional isocitrate dehydrogenase kinase/phosphatase [Marinobacterium sedimentorum]|uniref:bifunctional isocitrate dehydrogenase kinase/phosphatase n=1 Tax=Marinobacterium sedimentorum TaxID=2927804 RepID=UPI0020C5E27A|nr:bifunctional isocitrate dehydrogenase kinase/phosphatase [Marinobacterium sedimentorum]MCP8689085.1 bifunctional isocitrate dehydrogenase kinase/phosphatase [Marinobacterium sedimentorum]
MSGQFAERIADAVLEKFADYRTRFQNITAVAQLRFEKADWHAIQRTGAARIDLYEDNTEEAARAIVEQLGEVVYDARLWHDAKRCYALKIQQRNDPELAETFYNSIYLKVFRHHELDDALMFIRSAYEGKPIKSGEQFCRLYSTQRGLVALLGQLLDDYAFNIPWENRRRDIRNLARHARKYIPFIDIAKEEVTVEVMRSMFFRNKGAYIVGRINYAGGAMPFILPVLHNGAGAVYVDTLILEENDVSVIFSFTRSYFMVDVNVPSEFIGFLHTLIPMKSKAELYSSIGFYKQGKAEFYRSFLDHLEASDDQFVIAPGIKGMVMTVFTLPSFPVVFKLIKDRFSSSKNVTRATVKEKYQLVKRHDRAGRMADTQEFTNFLFPRSRFTQALIDELQKVAASSIEIDGDLITIRHLWAERRMTPLNIYIDRALANDDEPDLFHAINEFGKAIKQLAAANIFAGDMLFKNFGVTRHGRVVFYDYDEIMYLTDCNFRRIPEAMYPEQEMSGEPWYSISPNDVFPEEFTILTACNAKVRRLFNELHGDLLEASFWQRMQQQVREGEIVDLFPYRQIKRFARTGASQGREFN